MAGSNRPETKHIPRHKRQEYIFVQRLAELSYKQSRSCVFLPFCSVPSCCWSQQPELIQAGIWTGGSGWARWVLKWPFTSAALWIWTAEPRDIYPDCRVALCVYTCQDSYRKEQHVTASQVSHKGKTKEKIHKNVRISGQLTQNCWEK